MSFAPIGIVTENAGNVVAPFITNADTNTSDMANGGNGGGGTAGSG